MSKKIYTTPEFELFGLKINEDLLLPMSGETFKQDTETDDDDFWNVVMASGEDTSNS